MSCTEFQDLFNRIMLEDLYRCVPGPLAVHLNDKQPKTLVDACRLADDWETFNPSHSTAHRRIVPPGHLSGFTRPKDPHQGPPRTCNFFSGRHSDPAATTTHRPPDRDRCKDCGQKGHWSARFPGCPKQQRKSVNLVSTDQPPKEWAQFRGVAVAPLGGSLPQEELLTMLDTGADVSLIARTHVPAGAHIREDERWTISWVEEQSKDIPTVQLQVSTPWGPMEHRLGVVSSIKPGCQFLLGRDLLWRLPQEVPLRCMTALAPPEPPPTKATPQPDLGLGDVPWLQEGPMPTPESQRASRIDTLLVAGAAAQLPELRRSQLIAAQHEDDDLLPLREEALPQLEDLHDLTKTRYLVEDNVLYKISRGLEEPAHTMHKMVVVPRKLQTRVLQLAHDGLGGHFGVNRTARLLEGKFYWPGWRKSVKTYVTSCPACQRVGKPNEVVPKAPIQNIPSVGVPFQDVVIDYYTPEGRRKQKTGNSHVLTIIDRFTRYPEAIPVRSTSSKNAVKALLHFFCRFGFPATIQSDGGSHFMSKEFRDSLASHGITHLHSTPYHPESQGIIERFHQTLGARLSTLIEENGGGWEDNLPYALFSIRQAPSETLGYSPFELLFAHSTRGPLDILYDAWADPEKAAWAENLPIIQRNLQAAWAVAQAHESATQERVKLRMDKKASTRSFEVGEQVMVLRLGASRPLQTHFTGPHKILAKRGQLNYLVDCGQRRAKWLHINLLKPFQERGSSQPALPDQGVMVGSVSTFQLPEKNSQILANIHRITPGLEESKRKDISDLLRKYPQVTRDDLGCTSMAEHAIRLEDNARPIAQGYYKVNPQRAERIQAQVQLQLDMGLIEKSTSPWSSPVVLVPKEEGGDRLCIDFRKLNAVTQPEPYPLPHIEVCLDSLGQAPFLSKIDLEKGYWQVPLADGSRHLTAFSTPSGHYQCRVMPFGLKNAPSCFQRLMNEVLAGIPNCVVYLDDIVIFANSWEEHLKILAQVFQALQQANLVVNLRKCQFGVAEITYLGHVVGNGKLMPKDANVQAIREMPYPTTKKDAQRFLGMVQYFKRFIPNLSEAAAPITNLFRGNQEFRCTPECKKAYDYLKGILISNPVLRTPDYDRPFYMAVDASDIGVGAVLFQEKEQVRHPVAYYSKKLNPAQTRYSTIEKELLGLVLAMKHFESYHSDHKFPLTILTDHNPLVYLTNFRNQNKRLMRWCLDLQDHNWQIQHIKGTDNKIADVLSRQ
ncbi:uncharacterized protein LOC135197485 [Macrobrachium nipponense]|uniref:uncharacterized protein LOC135197485 n=1 Tax=Macrobrachium nipponense TaxID=159736 RepID=UPI0030C896CE